MTAVVVVEGVLRVVDSWQRTRLAEVGAGVGDRGRAESSPL